MLVVAKREERVTRTSDVKSSSEQIEVAAAHLLFDHNSTGDSCRAATYDRVERRARE